MQDKARKGATLLAMTVLFAATACSQGAAPAAEAQDAPAAEAAPAPAPAPAAQAAPAPAAEDDAAAGSTDPMRAERLKLAVFSGSMQAMSELCGVEYDPAQLEASKQEQRRALAVHGVSAADFDDAFDSGYTEAKAKFAGATTAQREQGCQQLRQLGEMGQRMQQG